MSGIELAANYYTTRAHYSDNLADRRFSAGRSGYSLCNTESNPVRVYDQTASTADQVRWGGSPKSVKKIEDLPVCKKCAKAAEKRQSSS